MVLVPETRILHAINFIYLFDACTGCLKLIYKVHVYGSDGSSYKLMSESMKAVHYCIKVYIDGKGIGWATIELNFIKIRSLKWLQPRCKDKRTAKKI